MKVDPRLRRAAAEPPRGTEGLADLGGVIRARLEDFEVEEIPAYGPDGGPESGAQGHLLAWLHKRGMSTPEAVRELARYLGVGKEQIGVAGLKDRDAVTRQQISVPAVVRGREVAPRLAEFEHPALRVEDPRLHSHKLRRGHLRANRFRIVVRELEISAQEALARAAGKLARLREAGLRNYYGEQRFGLELRNLEPGLAALAGRGRRRGRADFTLSVGQSALFNLYLATRAERGELRRVLLGDVLQKRESGGMFVCQDPEADQLRLDAGELVVTGPMFGAKMRAPPPNTAAAALEDEVLEIAQITRAKLGRLGRAAPGTRRKLLIWPAEVPERAFASPFPASPDAVELHFVLPPGSYATVLLRELCG